MKDEKFKKFAYDLSILIKEKAKKAKSQKDLCPNIKDFEYQMGYLMAYHEIVDLIKNEADAFNISQQEIGMIDIDPEVDLL